MESPASFREYLDMIKNGMRLAWGKRPQKHSASAHPLDRDHDIEGVDAANAKQELRYSSL